jgi:outer membrane protein assembly factor BamB
MGLTLCAARCYSLPDSSRHRRLLLDLAGAPVRQHLLSVFALVLVACLAGCRTPKEATNEMGQLATGGLLLDWPANLGLRGDRIKAIHIRGDVLVAYTQSNRGFWMTAKGGEFLNSGQIADRGHTLHPPVALNDALIIPTTGAIKVYDKTGRLVTNYETPAAIQSPAAGSGESLYLGVSHEGAGRLAQYKMGKQLVKTWEIYTGAGIVAAPVVYGGAVYAGGYDGQVWAMTPERSPIWSFADRTSTFKTAGHITADLTADEYGLYVASQDRKLYCLDRTSGKIKWLYYASAPLVDQPIVIGNFVYQHVNGTGMVAINKTEGTYAREPVWVKPGARQVLSTDEKNVYLATDNHTILAVDKLSGEARFSSHRRDLTVFATNEETPTIYAGTSGGEVLAIRPVIKPGGVGQVVLNQSPAAQPLASALP